ncbi:carboxynorspermidine decarboxylase [Planctomycetales bacterium]|nr:carboxynorspermidine decarboxylase [Planctomycetales bacterium]GHT44193.1 carboxynorspermidine decarboxylase [Planctomycetales bacterium]
MNRHFDYASVNIETPYYIIDRAALRRNMEIHADVQKRTGCKILLAMKAFSTWCVFHDMTPYLAGAAASSVNEVLLAKEEFGKIIQMYSPAYSENELKQVLPYIDYLVFNSARQYENFRHLVKEQDRKIHCGYRINPEYSEVQMEIYNPCTNRSRFGMRAEVLQDVSMKGIDGLHFHTMCQQGSDVLFRTLELVEERFEKFLHKVKWINFGGGHHITRKGYDVDGLCEIINDFKEKYELDIFLEPGESHILNTGYLVSTVLDVIENPTSIDVVILDTSAAAHMPDVIEMPYTPEIQSARRVLETTDTDMPLEEGRYKYIIGSKTCLSGDIIGEYLFKKPLRVGDRVVLADMAQYTICKNTTFNGIRLPSIVTCDSSTPDGDVHVVREFHYEDFKTRLS